MTQAFNNKEWFYKKMFIITDKELFNKFKQALKGNEVVNLKSKYDNNDFNNFRFHQDKSYYRIGDPSHYGVGTYDGYKKMNKYGDYDIIKVIDVRKGNIINLDYLEYDYISKFDNFEVYSFTRNIEPQSLYISSANPSGLSLSTGPDKHTYTVQYDPITSIDVDYTSWTPVNLYEYITGIKPDEPNNQKEEDKIMRLLEIYKQRKVDAMEKAREEKREQVRFKDKTYAAVAKLGKDVSFHGEFSDELKAQLKEVDNEYYTEDKKVGDMLEEVEAQVAICETYEQKVNVLKLYGILDEEGKLSI